MLVTTKKILGPARRGRYAVGAFNVNNMEILQAVIAAGIRMKSPLIIQTSEGAISYAGMDYLIAMTRLAASSPIPVALHLDHGKNLKIIKKAIDSGYTSVMFDGSHLPLAKNIKFTRQVVSWARRRGVSVEAELGAIAGIEDFVSVSARDAHLTGPEEARDFVRRTGCDSLAVAIGTAHGAYKFKGAAKLDLARLAEIRKKVSVPLVLHGASGVPQTLVRQAEKFGARLNNPRGVSDTLIKKAVRLGICKINTDTDLRLAFTAGVRSALAENPKEIDPRKILGPAREIIQRVVKQRINIFGSKNKA
ncbi:MAG: class II fructose-1,6-bisphosphate aldolase [Patescibacteria group bacterium]|nr:class II fructose-1,6-bisphosphate aldolase [Patescibacteria group bacterium]